MPTTKFKEINGKECIGEIDYDIEVNKEKKFRLNLIYFEEKYRDKGYGTVIIKDHKNQRFLGSLRNSKEFQRDIIKKAKHLGCRYIVVDLTKPDYDYYSIYKQRKAFFEGFGFKFDKEGDYARLDLG